MKHIPYTTKTGVKIGLRWNESPKPMPIDDPDMIEIQGWFIGSSEYHRQRKVEKVVYTASTVLAVLVAIAMMVFR